MREWITPICITGLLLFAVLPPLSLLLSKKDKAASEWVLAWAWFSICASLACAVGIAASIGAGWAH